ncbi:hypothetical protein [Nocardia stercoris]|nr:hypothetical protein [Nocardia stercoris]
MTIFPCLGSAIATLGSLSGCVTGSAGDCGSSTVSAAEALSGGPRRVLLD